MQRRLRRDGTLQIGTAWIFIHLSGTAFSKTGSEYGLQYPQNHRKANRLTNFNDVQRTCRPNGDTNYCSITILKSCI